MPDYTYIKIYLNTINEFKTYTVNPLKRDRRWKRGRRRRRRRGAIETTLSEIGKGNNV
jgi:hypothetical protein